MKKVLLIIIDALSPAVLWPAIEQGRLPTFAALADRGRVRDCCSVFPSITHACLSSIATGEYPIEHGIIGTFWYEKEKEEICYYGAQPWVVLNQGLNKFLEELLSKWNEERLKCPTLFEIVEDGGLRAACLNHLVYRGRHRYKVHEPLALKMIPGLSTTPTLNGPSIFFLGDFVHPTLPGRDKPIDLPHGLATRFGMSDEATLAALGALAGAQCFPELTVAYFPDNDVKSHAVGPRRAEMALHKIDVGLRELVRLIGGLDRFLSDFVVIIHGDHAQVEMEDGENSGGILLEDVLSEFRLADAGDSLDCEHDLLVAPNLRTCFVYCRECDKAMHSRIVTALLDEERVDQVLWQADLVEHGCDGYVVRTADRGQVRFWKGADGEGSAKDDYGCEWSWEGSAAALDFRVEGSRLKWGAYPNAFERIACGMGPAEAGHVWATARVGHGFRMHRIKSHAGGGSHASLHRLDSVTPMIAAGLPEPFLMPPHPRIVDTAPLILRLLGLPGRGMEEPRYREELREAAV